MLSEKPDYLTKEKRNFQDLEAIVKALRSDEGCSWDRKQTHSSIDWCMIEEAAEAVDGIRLLEKEKNPDSLREELGDVLFQVVLHSAIAQEEGYFSLDDVVEDISAKMIRRHPHVFGIYEKDEKGEEIRDWNLIKQREKEQKTFHESKSRKKRRKRLSKLFLKLLSL